MAATDGPQAHLLSLKVMRVSVSIYIRYGGIICLLKQLNLVYSGLNYRVYGSHFIPALLLSQ